MAAKPLAPEDLAPVVAAIMASGGNVVQAADAMNMRRGTFNHRLRTAIAGGLVDLDALRRENVKRVDVPAAPRLPVTADECWSVIDEWIGVKRMQFKHPQKWQAKTEQRIVVAGDFHAPYHDPEAVAELIARESHYTDTLIISGDLFDLYSVSRFTKVNDVTIRQEWAAGTALLAQLAAAFPDVLIIHGNHDERIERQLRAILPPELAHAVELLTGGDFSILRQAAKRHNNVRVANHVAAGGYVLPWLVQVGDLIVSHAEKYSITPGAALRKIEEALSDFEHVYQLKDWRVLIQGHTHQHSCVLWHSDKMLIEGGCMCANPQGYQMNARVGGRSQKQGYVRLVQRDGKTDPNSVKFHWLNAERKIA